MSPTPEQRLRPERLRLPTLPAVVQRVQALLQGDACGTAEIAEVVVADPALAARVLRIANSAFYGLRERCISTEKACTVLGLRALQQVVLQAGVLQHYEHLRRHPGFDLDELWRHSILTAQLSSFLAQKARTELPLGPEELHTCGLLNDIGQLVLLDELGDDYLDVVAAARLVEAPLSVIERRMLGTDHNEVGALVAEHWGLPAEVADAIRYHHGPRERVQADPLVSLVAHANLVVTRVIAGDHTGAHAALDGGTAAFLGLEEAQAREAVRFAIDGLSQVEI